MPTVQKTIGAWLRELREGADLTLRDLADKVGYDPATLSRIERNEIRITVDILDAYLEHTVGVKGVPKAFLEMMIPVIESMQGRKSTSRARNEVRAAFERFFAQLPLDEV